MSGADQAVDHIKISNMEKKAISDHLPGAKTPSAEEDHGSREQQQKSKSLSMDHVLLALTETVEQRIRSLFSFFDASNRGYLDYLQIEAGLKELCEALVSVGIQIGDEELARFVQHVDKDNNGIITFEEWRDFLLLYPHEATIENIYQYWGRVCLVDIGEQAVISEGMGNHVNASKYLVAGGIAGATSRTATAPLDRLKVVLQVQTTRANITPAIKDIWKGGRLLVFFRGNGINVMKVAPESAIKFYIKFYTYEMIKKLVANEKVDTQVILVLRLVLISFPHNQNRVHVKKYNKES